MPLKLVLTFGINFIKTEKVRVSIIAQLGLLSVAVKLFK